MPQHGRRWMSQAPSLATHLKTSQNAPKWLLIWNGLCWRGPVRSTFMRADFQLKCWDEGKCHWVDWSLVVSAWEMGKPSANSVRNVRLYDHRHLLWRDALSHSGCLAPSVGGWTVQSVTGSQGLMWPSGPPTTLQVEPFDQRLQVVSLESIYYFGFGNREVPSRGSRSITNDVHVDIGLAIIHAGSYVTLFCFSSLRCV